MTRVSELYYEEIGSDFQRFMSPYDASRRVAMIHRLLRGRRFGRAMEVGCGTGEISKAIVGCADQLMVCDISETLARSVGNQLRCEWSQQDACSMTVVPESYDLVVSSECIEHTPDPWLALSQMANALRPGGTLVVTTPNRLWYSALIIGRVLRLRKFRGNEIWISHRAARRWLAATGFVNIRFTGCHLFPWQIPGSKPILRRLDRWGDCLYPLMVNFGFTAQKRCF